MLTFEQKYSGSDGNLYLVTSPEGRFLIEAGVPWAKLQKALDYDLSGIKFCLISHADSDHSFCYEKLTEFGINIFATHETFDILPPVKRQRRLKAVIPDKWFTVGSFSIMPFEVFHDREGTVGFIVEQGTESLFYATDTSYIAEDWSHREKPFTIIAIEASWDKKRIEAGLLAGKINAVYANRLMLTHQEVSNCKLWLNKFCDLSRCREINLIHVSSTCDKAAIKADFEEEFLIPIFIK